MISRMGGGLGMMTRQSGEPGAGGPVSSSAFVFTDGEPGYTLEEDPANTWTMTTPAQAQFKTASNMGDFLIRIEVTRGDLVEGAFDIIIDNDDPVSQPGTAGNPTYLRGQQDADWLFEDDVNSTPFPKESTPLYLHRSGTTVEARYGGTGFADATPIDIFEEVDGTRIWVAVLADWQVVVTFLALP